MENHIEKRLGMNGNRRYIRVLLGIGDSNYVVLMRRPLRDGCSGLMWLE